MAIREDLELDLSGALSGVDQLDSALGAAVQSFEVGLAGALGSLQGVTVDPIDVPVTADTAGMDAEIDAALATTTADIPVTADTTGMDAEIDAATAGTSAEITVTADTAEAEASISGLGETAAGASGDVSGLGGAAEGTGVGMELLASGGAAAGAGLNTTVTAADSASTAASLLHGRASTATTAVGGLAGAARGVAPDLAGAAAGMSNLSNAAMSAPGPIQATIAAIGAGVGVGLGLTGTFTGLADKVRSFSTITGESAQSSSNWVGAASVMGIESGKLNQAFARASVNISNNEQELARNGVTVARNADGSVNLTQTIHNAGEAFRNNTNETERNRIAQELFGRSWRDMIPILSRTSEEIEALGRKSGLMMSQADLNRASAFKIELNALKTQVSVLAGSLGSELLPAVQGNITTLSALVVGLQQVHAVDFAAKVVSWVNPLNSLGDVIGVVTGKIDPMTGKVKDNSAAQAAAAAQAQATAAAHQGQASAADLVAASGGNAERALAAFALSEDSAAIGADQVTKALQEQVKAQDAVLQAAQSYVDLQLGLQGSILAVKDAEDALSEANAKVAFTGGSVASINREQEHASLNLARAVSAVAHANAEQEINQRRLQGVATTTADETRIYNDSLNFVIGTLSGPMQAAVLGHITTLNQIPGQKATTLLADPGPANAAVAGSRLVVDGWSAHVSTRNPPLNANNAPGVAAVDGLNSRFGAWENRAVTANPPLNANNAPAVGSVDGLNSRFGEWENHANTANPNLNANPEPGKASVADLHNKSSETNSFIESLYPSFKVDPGQALGALGSIISKAAEAASAVAGAVAGAGGSWNPLNRMAGGPVNAGQAYIVGERHAELFVPDRSGSIVPRVPPMANPEAAGGTVNITIPVDARGATMTEAQFRRVAREEIAPFAERVVAKVRSK